MKIRNIINYENEEKKILNLLKILRCNSGLRENLMTFFEVCICGRRG
jgi:hypothetical protein